MHCIHITVSLLIHFILDTSPMYTDYMLIINLKIIPYLNSKQVNKSKFHFI